MMTFTGKQEDSQSTAALLINSTSGSMVGGRRSALSYAHVPDAVELKTGIMCHLRALSSDFNLDYQPSSSNRI